jgi:hypothetical protein
VYSTQETDSYTFTGATVGLTSPLSSSSAASTGTPAGSESNTGTLDVGQSYVGPAIGRPAENTFTPVGLSLPDYVRGDALTTPLPIFTTNNVAEAFFTGSGNAAGSGSWAVTAPISLSAAGTLSLTFHYTNDLALAITGPAPGSVAADYNYTVTIRDSSGAVVYTASPDVVNNALSLIAPGAIDLPGSGILTITSGVLTAGTYTGSIQGSEHVFVDSAVPEPSSAVLLGVPVAIAICVLVTRRKSAPL